MANRAIVGIRFAESCKMYYFDPLEFDLSMGDHVIVETSRGMDYGKVIMEKKEMPEELFAQPIRPVIRKATEQDAVTVEENHEKEKAAFEIAKQKIAEHGLEMKLVNVEYSFDRSKILFYFIADGRVDFRLLVKDLAGIFHTRIELRQIGVRDETRMKGGIGVCGRELCCHSYMEDFVPVSIKMAKDQNLSLNPTKISGVCGRLMCCLKNEEETYEFLNSRLPKVGTSIKTPDGMSGIVTQTHVLRQKVNVMVQVSSDEREMREYTLDELQGRAPVKEEQNVETDESVSFSAQNAGSVVKERSDGSKAEHQGKDGRSRNNGRRENHTSSSSEDHHSGHTSREHRSKNGGNEKHFEKSGNEKHSEKSGNEKHSEKTGSESRQNSRHNTKNKTAHKTNENQKGSENRSAQNTADASKNPEKKEHRRRYFRGRGKGKQDGGEN